MSSDTSYPTVITNHDDFDATEKVAEFFERMAERVRKNQVRCAQWEIENIIPYQLRNPLPPKYGRVNGFKLKITVCEENDTSPTTIIDKDAKAREVREKIIERDYEILKQLDDDPKES